MTGTAEISLWNRDENRFYMGSKKVRSDKRAEVDLSSVRLLNAGIDTFKQLYRGCLNPSVFANLEYHYEQHPDTLIQINECKFQIVRSSKVSGYQYILKDLFYGVVVLVKSYYADLADEASHLKIECSPHFVNERSSTQVDGDLLNIASHFLYDFTQHGTAVHLAVDLKGYQIPDDFEQRLRAKAKRSFAFTGIDDWQGDLRAVSVRYGRKESLTFGSASQLQMCIYDKILECNHSDKLSYWQSIWKQTPAAHDPFISEYREGDGVTRLEFRLHHTVVEQFSKGTGKGLNIRNMVTLSNHLTGLWQYCINNFRLHYSKKYIDPVWQLLLEDVVIHKPAANFMYKRSYKAGSSKSKRNVAFFIGNALRLYARQHKSLGSFVAFLMRSGLERELKEYFGFAKTSDDLAELIHWSLYDKYEKLLAEGAAV